MSMSREVIAIKSSEDLAKLIGSLAAEIGKSHDYWQLRGDLLKEFGEHPLVEQQSPTFWSMTLHALESGAILHLCRAFDQQPKALGLRTWLNTIKANLRLFEDAEFRKRKAGNPFIESLAAEPRVPDLQVLTKDIQQCSDKDPLVKRLIAYRGSALAHRSATLVLAERPGEDHPELTVDDVQTLLIRADQFLTRYSSLFAAEYYSQHVIGYDDYKFVIQSVNSEVRRLRGEAGLGPDET